MEISMSNLPKIDYPMYTITIPSTKKNSKFRPFLVKEEKLLLMAKESKSNSDILSAIKQVVNNCSVDNNFDINKIALFDLEYIFLKLRSFSINNIIQVSYKDLEDEKLYDFNIDLNDVEIQYPNSDISNVIKISEKSGIIMSYPSSKLYDDKDFLDLTDNYMFELILRCIDKVYYEDEIFETSNYTKQDLSEFLENLNLKLFEDIQKFLVNVPKMEYKINYKNSFNNDREIVLTSLNDFFTWR
jgi:hypothetical protein